MVVTLICLKEIIYYIRRLLDVLCMQIYKII